MYSTTFAGTPGTSLEAFDGWRILYADGGLTDKARISSGGSGIDALLTGSLSSWVIYSPAEASNPGSGDQYIRLSGLSYSPQHLHAMLRAASSGKSGFALRITNATTWNVWRVDNGAFTSLGSGSLSPALSTSDVFEFTVDGSLLTLTRNGASLLSYASATQYQANTDVGIPIRGTANNSEIIGGWESGDLGLAQPGVADGGLPAVTVTAPTVAAVGAAVALVGVPAVQAAGPAVAASGEAVAGVSLTAVQALAPQAMATGAAVAESALSAVSVDAPAAAAAAGGAGLATAALPAITVSAPAVGARGGAVAAALLPGVAIYAPTLAAAGSALAAAALPAILVIPPEAGFGQAFLPALSRTSRAGGDRGGFAAGGRGSRAVRI